MKLWHKRANIVGYYDLSADMQRDLGCEDCTVDSLYALTTDNDVYSMSEFTCSESHSRYLGLYAYSNTCAVGIVLSQDCEQAVLQCFT